MMNLILIGCVVAAFVAGVIVGVIGTNISISNQIGRHFGW